MHACARTHAHANAHKRAHACVDSRVHMRATRYKARPKTRHEAHSEAHREERDSGASNAGSDETPCCRVQSTSVERTSLNTRRTICQPSEDVLQEPRETTYSSALNVWHGITSRYAESAREI